MTDLKEQHTQNVDQEADFSFTLLFQQWTVKVRYTFKYWKKLLAAALAGALIALLIAWLQPVTYTSRLSFVVEESKSGGGASLASALTGQLGIDLGSFSGSNGILSGDNVLELLKSRSLIKKTLLTAYEDSGNTSLADQYATIYNWKEQWLNNSKIGRLIQFPPGKTTFTRLEDSLLYLIINRIGEAELSISKPDKKLGFFEILVTSRDEKFSQLFSEKLLDHAAAFYIETKTRRLKGNVDRLERRADSLAILLNHKTYSAADANLLLLNNNPAYTGASVTAEISSREKSMQGMIYAEIVKNLEISKTALIQETPTVQVVDDPELPLKKNKISKLLAILIGMVSGTAIAMIILINKRKD